MDSDQLLVIATHNAHKFAEVVPLFSDSPWMPVLASELEFEIPEVDETGMTFAENALLKARAFQAVCNLPVLADDTGLEVAALSGAPGVHSNRWHPGSYEDRNIALLEKLAGVADRSASFTTVVCLLFPGEEPQYFTGRVAGTLATEQRGSHGFGYDSLFVPEGQTQTFGELGEEFKQDLSHRSRAVTQAIAFLHTK